MNILITDIDNVIISKSGTIKPKNDTDWIYDIDPATYKKLHYDTVYIISNQFSKQYGELKYISNVLNDLKQYIDNIEIYVIRYPSNIYRKPYSTIFKNILLPKLQSDDKLTFVGKTVTDYYFYCNCMLYAPSNIVQSSTYFYVTDWKSSSNPTRRLENTNRYINTDNITWKKNKKYAFYCCVPDLIPVFENHFNCKLIKKTTHYSKLLVLNDKTVTIYIGDLIKMTTPLKTDFSYIINTEQDAVRCARFYHVTKDITFSDKYIENFYVNVTMILKLDKAISLYPPLSSEFERNCFREFY